MDKRKATLTLTEKLNGLGYINLVSDPSIKSYLLDNAKSVVFDTQKNGRIRILSTDNVSPSNFENDIIKTDNLPYTLRGYKEANYFFLEQGYYSKYNLFVTPIALIGKTEEKVLRESFYKNVPEKVLKAFEVLEIPNFIDAYSVYYSLKGGEDHTLKLGIYRPFKKEDKIELGDIIQGATSKRYYLVDKIENDGSIDGHRFQDEALKTPATGKKDDEEYSICDKSMIIPIKKRSSDIDFFDFVFSLPYEDQNIELNKTVLKGSINIDCFSILQKEYSTGKYFKDYFSALEKEVQNKVVEMVKSLPSQDKFLNSWLFNQGFDVKIDHIELYKKDTKGFITYFKRGNKELQELIVSDLFNCEHINKEVIEFLEKEYSHLLRDAAFKNESPAR